MSASAREVYFLGLAMPFEARRMVRTLPTLESVEPLLEAVMASLLAQTDPDPKKLQRAMSLDSTTLAATFTGMHWLVRACMRSGLKLKALAVELADIKVHQPSIEPILRIVQQGRTAHDTGTVPSSDALLPDLRDLRWRLDVIISTSGLHRVLRPQLTMQCSLSDGTQHAFNVSKPQFHQLRYTAAKLRKDMQDLEARMPASTL